MKTIAVMPIKLYNERCPMKNIRLLGNKPLLQYELDNLKETNLCESINVFCSSEEIIPFLSEGVHFIKRAKYLDLSTVNFTQIFEEFMIEKPADIYVYAHATAPYITVPTMVQCIKAVQSGNYDSAFCAVKLQDYLWQDGNPLNFDATNIPRTQDLKPIYKETSGIYVFERGVFEKYHRRIGINPFIKEVSFRESIDIDTTQDFSLAEIFIDLDLV